MNLINWLTSPVAEALGWTLIHTLWQGFAVVLTVALLLHLTRRSRAALRYQLGMSGLLAQMLASVITFGWYYEPRSLVTSVAINQTGFRASLLQMTPDNESWLLTTQAFLNAHLAEVVWIWLVGIGVFGVRLIGGWAYVQRLKTTATLPVPSMLTEVMARIAPKLAVSARLQLSARASGPMVVGVLKPVVLWPVGLLAGLSVADVEAVLAHELAHVRRHDYLLNVLQSVVEVLYFFHPALWWLSARVREEREHCCDDVAVEIIGDARALARALARVEEWQRSAEAVSDLAMGFASKRQLLLQRVRRMLGVPTRPLVSNGSLAGLTLVTMLLLSVSVYAVQRTQEEPKPARQLAPTQTNRRHRVDRNSEYGMTNNQRVTYVIWKGQKLPASRVARLQNQLDRVMNGQLNLDTVKQPDRDILLTVIEKNVAFDVGMKALSEGMAHIDYGNVVVNANSGISDTIERPIVHLVDSVQVNGKWIKHSDYYQSMDGFSIPKRDTSRLSAVQRQLEILTKQMQEIMTERQPIADKLSKEMAELTLKNEGYQKKAGQFAKQQVALARQQSVMAKQQAELARKLNPLNREIERLARLKTAQASQLMKQKELQSQLLEKQMNELGDKMGKMGSQMGDIGNQMQSQMEPYQQRMGVLADSINKLYEPTYAISEKIGELSEKIAEEAGRQADEAAKQAEEAVRQVEAAFEKMDAEGVYRDRPARAVRPSRPVRPARPPRPATASRPPRPSVDATPAIAPTPPPAPARAPRPAPTPRVAPVPTPAAAPKPPK
ncbi:MAG: M48 family metalloprotease [Rudanella sp.]|nr:M48 family metalloprotease [Rudanella sp.]